MALEHLENTAASKRSIKGFRCTLQYPTSCEGARGCLSVVVGVRKPAEPRS
jgi:hypothetical protein